MCQFQLLIHAKLLQHYYISIAVIRPLLATHWTSLNLQIAGKGFSVSFRRTMKITKVAFWVGLNLNFEFESTHKLLMNLKLNSTLAKSMNLNLVYTKSMNLNLNVLIKY